MSSPLITLRNATCGYGARDILTDVDLEIRASEAVALLGANGAGKSTLLKAITLAWLPCAAWPPSTPRSATSRSTKTPT